MTTAPQPARSRRNYFFALALLACTSLAGLGYPSTRLHLRAISLLLRIEDAHATGKLAAYDTHPIAVLDTTVQTAEGQVAARLYVPKDVPNPPGMVVVHGVHHLGIEEPRLVNFSRALAMSGIAVLTPQLASLADYHVSEGDIPVIGDAARTLHQRVGTRVGVLGLSFAGGLSLLAAADPQFVNDIGFVVAIGSHDDLERVCRFFATDKIAGPDGKPANMTAHEYGALVVAYSHVEDYFAPADVPAASEALRLHLWEQPEASRAAAAHLSPEGLQKLKLLLEQRKDSLGPTLLDRIPSHRDMMARVSPHGHMGAIHVPVLLLHGSGDNVIPPTETEWLSREIPPQYLRDVLISPLITHVEVGGEPGAREKLALIDFMADMLKESDRLQPRW